jgi:hypothetical protein
MAPEHGGTLKGVPAMPSRSLTIDGREVFVETTALDAPTANFRTRTLRRAGSHLLVLKPSWQIRLFALAVLLAGATLATVLSTDRGKGGKHDPLGLGWGVLFASPFIVGGLLMMVLPCRIEFDRAAGRMRTCRLGSRREQSLRQVLAIQLLQGRTHQAHQLNLVLDGEPPERMNLTSDTNWEATRSTGAELADFLAVPLLEELATNGDASSRWHGWRREHP